MASPANLILVIVFRIALLEIPLLRNRVFLYRLASRASMSFLFQSPATTIGVPMYMRRERARQHVSCCSTSGSASLSLHFNVLRLRWICSLAVLLCSFTSALIFTPRYFTILVHLTSAICFSFSVVRISDFFCSSGGCTLSVVRTFHLSPILFLPFDYS